MKIRQPFTHGTRKSYQPSNRYEFDECYAEFCLLCHNKAKCNCPLWTNRCALTDYFHTSTNASLPFAQRYDAPHSTSRHCMYR